MSAATEAWNKLRNTLLMWLDLN